ncbi:hypothetical protein MpV1_225c [Micromonas sp. RCC1109 virus MpV1]|jgi:hypothetical protein|uniref:hypothetical protein n=1 Tax=Micromonas sp. RCC1109 virus MpV1 TaxID=880161 RepID=UPI0001EF4528|nr:hypothetical protein MpV1_225c [Micromonas sp. RCC1109 virus MpV1]ADQ91148.1 hypothetical protein MpV1_225c [Micromonas sp. RCC1109 virus MpV1]
MCFVYVLRNPGHRENVIKIGQTTNLRTRLSNLNSGNYLPFDVLHVRRFDDTEDDWRYNRKPWFLQVEERIHKIFVKYRYHEGRGKEWFLIDDIDLVIKEIDEAPLFRDRTWFKEDWFYLNDKT